MSSPHNQKKKPELVIVEQPTHIRFRYESEGNSSGILLGRRSTKTCKTYPTVRINGFQGEAYVVVSCVTKDEPYKQHPHNLVGKGCQQGVCTLRVPRENMELSLCNLGVKCVRRNQVHESLTTRKELKVDPFQAGFAHLDVPERIERNSIRLCFQAFIEDPIKKQWFSLKPVVSDVFHHLRILTDLTIVKLSDCVCPADGGTKEILLFVDKINRNDIQVRFFEEKEGEMKWESFVTFPPGEIHKNAGISFKPPPYHTLDIDEPAQVFVQLVRPSDMKAGEPRSFQYIPIIQYSDYLGQKRKKTKKSQNFELDENTTRVFTEIGKKFVTTPENMNHLLGIQKEINTNNQFSQIGNLNSKPEELDWKNLMNAPRQNSMENAIGCDGVFPMEEQPKLEVEFYTSNPTNHPQFLQQEVKFNQQILQSSSSNNQQVSSPQFVFTTNNDNSLNYSLDSVKQSSATNKESIDMLISNLTHQQVPSNSQQFNGEVSRLSKEMLQGQFDLIKEISLRRENDLNLAQAQMLPQQEITFVKHTNDESFFSTYKSSLKEDSSHHQFPIELKNHSDQITNQEMTSGHQMFRPDYCIMNNQYPLMDVNQPLSTSEILANQLSEICQSAHEFDEIFYTKNNQCKVLQSSSLPNQHIDISLPCSSKLNHQHFNDTAKKMIKLNPHPVFFDEEILFDDSKLQEDEKMTMSTQELLSSEELPTVQELRLRKASAEDETIEKQLQIQKIVNALEACGSENQM